MISVRLGRLHESETEALLRPVRADLAGLTAAGRGVDAAAGETVRARLEAMGDLPVGGAVVTTGGDLSVAFIVHVALEAADEPVTGAGVRRGLLNGLRRAREWEMASLSLPPLGLGAGTLDAEQAARAQVDALAEHLREGGAPDEIVIVVETPWEEELFRRLVAAAEPA